MNLEISPVVEPLTIIRAAENIEKCIFYRCNMQSLQEIPNMIRIKLLCDSISAAVWEELVAGPNVVQDFNRVHTQDIVNLLRQALLKINDTVSHNVSVQQTSFQRATQWLIILGQVVGLMPVHGVLRKPPEPLRFKAVSLKTAYGLMMFFSQTVISLGNVWIMFETNVSVTSVGHLSFYVSSAVTTIIFFNIAKKWPSLLKKIPRYELDEYVDPRVKTKCNMFIIMFLSVASVEHLLAECSGIAVVLDCSADYSRLYRDYIELSFPWVTAFGLPDHFLVGIFIQLINITATLTWSYSDLFIVCISYYLTSILQGIYRKLIDNKAKYLSSSFWTSIREDYNHAAQLVRAVDEVVSGAVFASFTINLFFICFQLYNLLSDGMQRKTPTVKCARSGSGLFGGYDNVIYLTYSIIFVLFRYLVVSLIASRVHTTSQSLAPALYDVPSTVYNDEVQRLLDQVHHETVALSGLQFFYVTKSLVLTVAGTIFTYELVLLQYGD